MFFKICWLTLLLATFVSAGLYHSKLHRSTKVNGGKFDELCNDEIENVSPNCGYYLFLTEMSDTTCNNSKAFAALANYIVGDAIPDGSNSYSIRYYGDQYPGWCYYVFNNKLEFEQIFNATSIIGNNCMNDGDPAAFYSDPFQHILSVSQNYPLLAVFLQGETDSITDLQNATNIAQQVANSVPMLYVYDHSTNGDQTGLFATLTGNQPGHIIRSEPNLAALKQKVQQQLIPDFLSVACSSHTVPTNGPTVSTTTRNVITTHRPSTATTAKPSTQVCSLLIFIEEASDTIGYDSKLMFLKLAQQIAMKANKNANQRYAIALYGQEVYQNIEAQNFVDFNHTITNLINVMAEQNLPNGRRTYLQPILSDLDTILYSGFISNFAVLLLAEADKIADPSKASPLFRSAVASGADIYVIDKSTSVNFWTGLPSSHILNGTGATQSSLFATLSKSLVPEFEKMKC